MALKLITADERLAQRGNKIIAVIAGRAKVGKTSLILTLPQPETLLLDFESGDLSIQDFAGDAIKIRTWPDALNAICLVAGPDPARSGADTFSQEHYDFVAAENASGNLFGRPLDIERYRYVYVDSISDMTRVAMQWAGYQPEAVAEKTGRRDMRGQYGLLGREVVMTLRHLQHTPGKSVFFVGGLDVFKDDFGRETYEIQTEGAKTGAEIPYIVDQVICLSDFDYSETAGWTHNLGKGQFRALCCKSPNPWGLPAGDRSGNLDLIEEPHLGRLIEKIRRKSNGP